MGYNYTKRREYEYVENMIALVICDICNGVPRSDIIKKLKEGLYEGQRKPYKEPTALDYYYSAMERIREDREENINELKDKLYSQFYSLYADAVKTGNIFVAKQVLDSVAKTFLPSQSKEANIEIDKSNDKINISFGFDAE